MIKDTMNDYKNTACTWILAAILLLIPTSLSFGQDVPSADVQIAGALSPAPDDLKEGAQVLGFNDSGVMIELRPGNNGFICLADNPMDERFHASCYHESLEPFMSRGRALRAEGKGRDENRNIRLEEIKRGQLEMPSEPAALYQLFGKKEALNMETGEVSNVNPLYVMYIPYATTESTGLSSQPLMPGGPWLMDAGQPWAHIMYSPGQAN